MIEIRRLGPEEWSTIRSVRLAALLDTPDWFWATHEEEVGRTEAWWRDFVGAGAWFVAFEGRRPVGIAAGLRDPELGEASRRVVSMWVEPAARESGVGTALIDAVVDWARGDGARDLQLQVTSGNQAAARLYERRGFALTSRSEAHPRDPTLIEREMRLVL